MQAMENAHALVVGIAHYLHVTPLSATVLNDARAIHAFLTDPAGGGYPGENVTLLPEERATNAELRAALKALGAQSRADSTVLVYVSSHGGRIVSGPHAGEYLLPVDANYENDVTLAQTSLAGDEFTALLNGIPARKMLVILDCCHAAGIGQPKDARAAELKAGLPESYYDKLAAGRGRAILASSRSTESSWVLPGADNSLFTQHLLAGLRGGIPSEDGLIRLFDVFEYLQPRVTSEQPNQHPVFKAEVEENFPVALRIGGVKSAAPRDAEGFRFDAYISYVDRGEDSRFVWETLLPRLEREGVRAAVSGDVEAPGVARVVNIERGIKQARRTVILLSPAYLQDNWADFENTLAQTLGIQQGTYPLVPVKIAPLEDNALPMRLAMLTPVDVTQPGRAERAMARLVEALKGAVPRR